MARCHFKRRTIQSTEPPRAIAVRASDSLQTSMAVHAAVGDFVVRFMKYRTRPIGRPAAPPDGGVDRRARRRETTGV